MKNRFFLTPQARQDLKEIKDYIARDSLDRAESFVLSIAERFRMLAEYPLMGRSYEELSSDLRGFSVKNYIVFYRPTPEGVVIVRIRSGYSDIDTLFPDDQDN